MGAFYCLKIRPTISMSCALLCFWPSNIGTPSVFFSSLHSPLLRTPKMLGKALESFSLLRSKPLLCPLYNFSPSSQNYNKANLCSGFLFASGLQFGNTSLLFSAYLCRGLQNENRKTDVCLLLRFQKSHKYQSMAVSRFTWKYLWIRLTSCVFPHIENIYRLFYAILAKI